MTDKMNIMDLNELSSLTPESLTDCSMIIERYTRNQEPNTSRIDIQTMYKLALDNLETRNWEVDIHQNLNFTKALYAPGNFSKLSANIKTKPINYYTIATELLSLDDEELTFENAKAIIYDYIARRIIDLHLPGSGSDGNIHAKINKLCLTKGLIESLIPATKAIVSEVFLNLYQILIVRRAWKLWGPGATLMGTHLEGNSEEVANLIYDLVGIKQQCSFNPSVGVFGVRHGHYLCGNSPYKVNLPTANMTLPFGMPIISSRRVFQSIPHTHEITLDWKALSDTTYTANTTLLVGAYNGPEDWKQFGGSVTANKHFWTVIATGNINDIKSNKYQPDAGTWPSWHHGSTPQAYRTLPEKAESCGNIINKSNGGAIIGGRGRELKFADNLGTTEGGVEIAASLNLNRKAVVLSASSETPSEATKLPTFYTGVWRWEAEDTIDNHTSWWEDQ
jgi:hypothetical protein